MKALVWLCIFIASYLKSVVEAVHSKPPLTEAGVYTTKVFFWRREKWRQKDWEPSHCLLFPVWHFFLQPWLIVKGETTFVFFQICLQPVMKDARRLLWSIIQRDDILSKASGLLNWTLHTLLFGMYQMIRRKKPIITTSHKNDDKHTLTF